jgi:hypothetical protein
MSTATISLEMAALLGGFKEATVLRDTTGVVLGVFTPVEPMSSAEAERLRKLFDLDRAKATLEREYHQGRPLQEIWATLNAREAKDGCYER